MILVDLDGVSMSRPGRPLFRDVSVTISSGDRLAVVGINGTGKSTLLGVMAGSVEPESGTVRRGRGVTVAVADQDPVLAPGTVRHAVGGGWRGEAVLDRLGLGRELDTDVDHLSGGQYKRVALARALVADADLLILDEPTNHLDVDAIEWLEAELAAFGGGLVLVTHDRHVLDATCTRVLELDRGRAHLHEGGYAAYLEGRARRAEHEAAAEATRRNLARRELAWLRRGAPARTRKSRARVEAATALVEARPEAPARGEELDLARLHAGTPRLGDQVIELHAVAVGHDPSRPLVRDCDLALSRRERLGIVGENGSGKTTLLEVMARRRPPLAGEVVWGPTVRLGVHDQQGRELDPRSRVWQVIAGDAAEPSWWDKALLESFWFDADAQWAPVELLSGGERRRLQLVATLAARPNVLLLDEPTNDLDLDTLRALEDFLDDWPGALVVASHDRAFLERTVDDVVVLDGGRAGRWPGGHAAWLAERRRARRRRHLGDPAGGGGGPTRRSRRPAGTRRRSVSTIRHELGRVDAELGELARREAELTGALQAGGDHARLAELGRLLAEVAEARARLEERWLELSVELDERAGA
ncbi:MAG: ABC transporter ATP-binding protein [Actinomyces sp.]|nr:MAG: ABC transporter ATP-binding protein [Actinomyces sp.]